MRSRWPAELGNSLLALLPGVATATAEGSWVTVVYAAALAAGNRPGALELWTFVLAAGLGLGATRGVRGAGVRAIVTWSVVGIATIVGVGAASDTLGQLAAGVSASNLHYDGAGLLLGVAAWRGTRHADPKTDDVSVAAMLRWGVPGLAIPWIVGTAVRPDPSFAGLALPATLLFVSSGLVAIGLTRLDALAREAGIDWRTNRTWLALLLGIVAAIAVVGIPTSFLLGLSLDTLAGPLVGPAVRVGGALAALADTVLAPIAAAVGALRLPVGPPSVQIPALPHVPVPGWVAGVAAIALFVALVSAFVVLARRVRGTPAPPPLELPRGEERHIAFPAISFRLPTIRLPRIPIGRPAEPHTASEAYLAVLGALEQRSDLARRPIETPAAHARRLRVGRASSLSFDLLAADFALERYAGRPVTMREGRRAVHRWRSLRRTLGADGHER